MTETTEYYEPWKPELGDRVRVRLSGECQDTPSEFDYPTQSPIHVGWMQTLMRQVGWPDRGHPSAIEGTIGTVDQITHELEDLIPDWWHGHWYSVWFDTPVVLGAGVVLSGIQLAAVELEPLGTRGPYGRGYWPRLDFSIEELTSGGHHARTP